LGLFFSFSTDGDNDVPVGRDAARGLPQRTAEEAQCRPRRVAAQDRARHLGGVQRWLFVSRRGAIRGGVEGQPSTADVVARARMGAATQHKRGMRGEVRILVGGFMIVCTRVFARISNSESCTSS
jgi:hypothetical protein